MIGIRGVKTFMLGIIWVNFFYSASMGRNLLTERLWGDAMGRILGVVGSF